MSDNKVPNFILMFSSWREGDGPFAPHPVFPDGFAWVKDTKSKEWVMSGGKGLTITRTMWLKATNQGFVSDFTSIEDAKPAPHIFDLIDHWPDERNLRPGLDAPEGWEWKYFGDDWCLSNGTVGLKHDEWFKYNFVESEPAPQRALTRDEVMALIDTWPIHLERNSEEITENWVWCGINGVAVIVDQSTGKTITESDWLEYRSDLSTPANVAVTAASMLQAALGHTEDRAKTYDTPGGERSMGKTVSAFNTITGLQLSEEQGWLFMEILKQVRSQQGNYRSDSYEDLVAYAALRGECAARERKD